MQEMADDLRETLGRLPKIDLHRHLEGSIRTGTIAELCRTHGVKLPTYDPEELAARVQLDKPAPNLAGFFAPFRIIARCFVNSEAIARITYEAVEDAWRDNVRYLELRFSPEFMAFSHGLSPSDVVEGIIEGVAVAAKRFPTKVRLIVSITRGRPPEAVGAPWAEPMEIARLAVKYSDRGVVGLDLAGLESAFSPELFRAEFEVARRAGLGITVHAGEDAGPESVRAAIERLGAVRIGHGVRILEDADVANLAVENGVVLEICPTSNVLTGVVESIEKHPARRLSEAGLRITINTDDPSVCHVNLTDEYALLTEKFGFALEEIEGMIETARDAAFSEL